MVFLEFGVTDFFHFFYIFPLPLLAFANCSVMVSFCDGQLNSTVKFESFHIISQIADFLAKLLNYYSKNPSFCVFILGQSFSTHQDLGPYAFTALRPRIITLIMFYNQIIRKSYFVNV